MRNAIDRCGWASFLLTACALACSGSNTPTDTGLADGEIDAEAIDLGLADVRSQDATAVDLGVTDAPDAAPSDAGAADTGRPDAAIPPDIALQDLQNWTRVPDPVFRDVFGGYQVAADPHVFVDEQGILRMIYSGDVNDLSSIKMARGSSYTRWTASTAVVSGPPAGRDVSRETSFYRRAQDGTHQIYFIGYEDEAVYRSEVYLAEATNIEGPYQIQPTPVVPLGQLAGRTVEVLTSPSVVDHDGLTYLLVLGWDAFEAVSAVWILGAVSRDDGRSFGDFQEVPAPIGMEGQVTRGPEGRFYATASIGSDDSPDLITLGRADHPFGPYAMLPQPIITQTGAPYELNEANAPMITFDHRRRTAHLFWHGANYAPALDGSYLGGYWVMTASTSY